MNSVPFEAFLEAFPQWADRVAVVPRGCWVWGASVGGGGYAGAHFQGRRQLVHRLAYKVLVESVPDGLVLDHLCRVRHCVNPNHLEPVTQSENILRGDGPAELGQRRALPSDRTHCTNGHELLPETTGVRFGGYVRCLICEREATRRSYQKNLESNRERSREKSRLRRARGVR